MKGAAADCLYQVAREDAHSGDHRNHIEHGRIKKMCSTKMRSIEFVCGQTNANSCCVLLFGREKFTRCARLHNKMAVSGHKIRKPVFNAWQSAPRFMLLLLPVPLLHLFTDQLLLRFRCFFFPGMFSPGKVRRYLLSRNVRITAHLAAQWPGTGPCRHCAARYNAVIPVNFCGAMVSRIVLFDSSFFDV